MAGRTNYTPTPAAFDPEVHIDAAQAHFDALIGESVATVASLPASGNWQGRTVVVIDTKATYKWFTGGWVKINEGIYASARGKALTTAIAGAGGSAPVYWGGYESVTFPVGRFSVPPIVVAIPGTASGSVLIGVAVSNITVTGFEYRLLRVGASPSSGSEVFWTAEQSTSVAAAG